MKRFIKVHELKFFAFSFYFLGMSSNLIRSIAFFLFLAGVSILIGLWGSQLEIELKKGRDHD